MTRRTSLVERERGRPCASLSLDAYLVVLDLDDTLYLERDFALGGFSALEPLVCERIGRSGFAAACRTLFEAGVRGRIFDDALAALGGPVEAELIPDLVEAYRAHSPRIALAPDAARFLARVPPGDCALISDGPAAMQRAKLRALGLEDKLGKIVLTGDLPPGCGKPHPMAYARIEQWSRRAAGAHVYIADNAAKDFLEPRRRGWMTIQILRPERVHAGHPSSPAHAAQFTITSFDALSFAGQDAGASAPSAAKST